jgi:hypothetical protein
MTTNLGPGRPAFDRMPARNGRSTQVIRCAKHVGRVVVGGCTLSFAGRGRARKLALTGRRFLVALIVVACALAASAEAQAADFTWSGAAPVGEAKWSNGANWEGGTAPNGTIGTLTFPLLKTPACELFPETADCYYSQNDIPGLTVNAISLACYFVYGNAITLGGGGLRQACHGGSILELPITLGAPQTWSIKDDNILGADVTGTSAALHIELVGEGALRGTSDVEAGPITITGEGIGARGHVEVSSLNGTDGNPVSLTDTTISGGGTIGALTTTGGGLSVGEGHLAVSGGVTLDPATQVDLSLGPRGAGRLTASGNVKLENAHLHLSEQEECYLSPPAGTSTLITTPGSLDGSFAGIPDGSTVQVPCINGTTQTVLIHYTAHSVEATILGTVPPTVATEPASSVSSTSAVLNGTVTPLGSLVTDCHFEYGETTAHGSTLPCAQVVGEGTVPVAVSASLAGLTPGTTYHVRLVATANGTRYGMDETFITTGSSTPTVTNCGADDDWGQMTAVLHCFVNPHNSGPLEAVFSFGTSPVKVSTVNDLLGYPDIVRAGTVGNGVSPVEVSATARSLQRKTTYSFRLTVGKFLGLGQFAVFGPEEYFSLVPPRPFNKSAPYLEDAGGFDPSKGFDLKCNVNTWEYASQFRIDWIFFRPDGTSGYAGGATRSVEHPGDVYHVTSLDVNRPTACVVDPEDLDGRLHLELAAQSETFLPVEPAGTLPLWLKAAFKLLKVATTAKDAHELLECAEFADVPFWGPALCVADATQLALDFAQTPFDQAVDPPDPGYRTLALPPRPPRISAGQACPRRVRGSRCSALKRASQRYASATGAIVSLQHALFVAENRFLVALKHHDPEAEAIQTMAFKVDFGLLGTAMQERHQAGVALANALRRDHMILERRVSVHVLAAALVPSTGAYRALAKRLMTAGFTKATLAQALAAFRRAVHHGGSIALNLTDALTAAVPAIPFAREYDTLGLNDLVAAVSAFARQDAIVATATAALYVDIDRARAACTLAARASALGKLLQDAKSVMPASYVAFLSAAAQPISAGQSNTDAYRRC